MEPSKAEIAAKLKYYRLILGKFQVQEVKKDPLQGWLMTFKFLNGTYISTSLPSDRCDVRAGDFITLYTEVPYNADAVEPSLK